MIIPRLIIPTVLIPFTLLGVVLSAVASFIAGLFGLHLRAEGPRRLLEALLKPRVLLAALGVNLAIWGGMKGWTYYKNLPRFLRTVQAEQDQRAQASERSYPDALQAAPVNLTDGGERSLASAFSMVWSRQLEGGSFMGAVAAGETAFIGTKAGLIHEINLADGATVRTFYIGTFVSPVPTLFNGALYAGEGSHDTHHARVYKFDLKSGRFEGAYPTKGHTEGQSTVGEWQGRALLFVPSGVDGIHAVDPLTLKDVWIRREGHSDGAVKVADGMAFWGTGREKGKEEKLPVWAVAADFNTGEIRWKQELPASSWMQPAVVGSHVCYTFGEVYFKSDLGGVACFDRPTGKPTVTFSIAQPVVSIPIVLDGDLIVTGFRGSVCRLEISTGRARWCTVTDGADYSLAYANFDPVTRLLIYPSQKGGLFALDPADGRIVTVWKPEGEEWKKTFAPAARTAHGWLVADFHGTLRLLRAMPIGKERTPQTVGLSPARRSSVEN